MFRLARALFLLAALQGCSGYRLALDNDLPARADLVTLQPKEQQGNTCGPTALALLLRAAGFVFEDETLQERSMTPALDAAFREDLLGAARRQGAFVYVLEPRIEAVLSEVAAGRPVLVHLNLGLEWLPRWHFAVVTGYDMALQEMTLMNGRAHAEAFTLTQFMNTWSRAGSWATVVLPPSAIPASAHDLQIIKAVRSNIEGMNGRASERDVRSIYLAGLTAHPGSLALKLALIESFYATGNTGTALKLARSAFSEHPDSAPLVNNLAHLLMICGNLEEAEKFAAISVALAGPHKGVSERTAREIAEAKGVRRQPTENCKR